jgi:hypothetical protein
VLAPPIEQKIVNSDFNDAAEPYEIKKMVTIVVTTPEMMPSFNNLSAGFLNSFKPIKMFVIPINRIKP